MKKTKTISCFSDNISMLNLSLNELKLVAKSRGIKGYKRMSKEILLSALSESKLVESKNNFDSERLKKKLEKILMSYEIDLQSLK